MGQSEKEKGALILKWLCNSIDKCNFVIASISLIWLIFRVACVTRFTLYFIELGLFLGSSRSKVEIDADFVAGVYRITISADTQFKGFLSLI